MSQPGNPEEGTATPGASAIDTLPDAGPAEAATLQATPTLTTPQLATPHAVPAIQSHTESSRNVESDNAAAGPSGSSDSEIKVFQPAATPQGSSTRELACLARSY